MEIIGRTSVTIDYKIVIRLSTSDGNFEEPQMRALQAEKHTDETSETSGRTDISPLVPERAKSPEVSGPNALTNSNSEQGPMRFGEVVSEPCSPEHQIATASPLATESRQSLEKALSKMPDKVLREEFKLEANTHKAMMQRVSAGKAKCVKRWRSLRPFLADILWELGRRPSPAYTLDRRDNNVKRYGPGLCRWALPEVQNNNRSCSVTINHPVTGEVLTATELAKITGLSERHARRLIKTKTASEIFAAISHCSADAPTKPSLESDWYDNWRSRNTACKQHKLRYLTPAEEHLVDKAIEEQHWRDFQEHFGAAPFPSLKTLPLSEDHYGSRGPDEEWLLIDETLRQERHERYEHRVLQEALAALSRYHSGEEPDLDFDHWWVLRGAGINMRKDADWEQFVSANPSRF